MIERLLRKHVQGSAEIHLVHRSHTEYDVFHVLEIEREPGCIDVLGDTRYGTLEAAAHAFNVAVSELEYA